MNHPANHFDSVAWPNGQFPEIDLVPNASTEGAVKSFPDKSEYLANSYPSFAPILLPTAGEQAVRFDKGKPLFHRDHTPVATTEFQ